MKRKTEVPSKTGNPFLGPAGIYRFLSTQEQTGNATCIVEVEVTPGNQSPLHTHSREHEVLHVLEGKCTVRVGSEVQELSPGDSALLPKGTEHSFSNRGQTSLRVVLIFSPGGFEGFLDEVSRPVDSGKKAEEFDKAEWQRNLITVGTRYGIEFRSSQEDNMGQEV